MEHYIKSNENSTRLREIGNLSYAKGNFFDAIVKYNESLCYAETKSENIGLAYANRSAVYCEMRLYETALKNIDLAKSHNYPVKNIEVLDKREEKCLRLMKNSLKICRDSKPFSLCCDPHKNYPSIANCLSMKSDNKFGRYVVTEKPLYVGDVIAIEEPVCKILQEDYLYQKCSHCMKSNLLDLIPCSSCSHAMYCSIACAQKAYNSYHQFECSIMKLITTSFLNANGQMALRTFFVGLALFDGSAVNLIEFLNENCSTTVFDFPGDEDMKQKFLAVNSLISDNGIEVNDVLFDELFQLDENLKQVWMSNRNDLRDFLKRHTQIGSLNYHEIYGWPLKKGSIDHEFDNFKGSLAYRRNVRSFGSGSYLFCSLVNHSCAPNVSKVFVDDKIFMIVQRPIKAGDQIFDNYGYSFTNIPRDVRQMELFKQYRFLCNCMACYGNFGSLPSLKIIDKSIFRLAKKSCQELSNLNFNRAKQKLRELSQILQKDHAHFPSAELCSMIESFQACLEIFLKPEIMFS